MHIAVLGTGAVGRTLADRFLALGHSITMGSRSADSDGAVDWLAAVQPDNQDRASVANFAAAAAAGTIVINATAGMVSLAILTDVGPSALAGKVLLDVANPLDFSQGFPPRLSVCNDDSLAEAIQREFPGVKVVKSLNTMNCEVMANPGKVPGHHVVFVAGNDADAKAVITGLLSEMGWGHTQILDLGDLSAARGTEMFLPLWLRIMGTVGNADFNIDVVRPIRDQV